MLTTINSTLPLCPAFVFPSTEATAKAEPVENDRPTRRSASRLVNFKVLLAPGRTGPVYVLDTAAATPAA
jgi:hypothetical protein